MTNIWTAGMKMGTHFRMKAGGVRMAARMTRFFSSAASASAFQIAFPLWRRCGPRPAHVSLITGLFDRLDEFG